MNVPLSVEVNVEEAQKNVSGPVRRTCFSLTAPEGFVLLFMGRGGRIVVFLTSSSLYFHQSQFDCLPQTPS